MHKLIGVYAYVLALPGVGHDQRAMTFTLLPTLWPSGGHAGQVFFSVLPQPAIPVSNKLNVDDLVKPRVLLQ